MILACSLLLKKQTDVMYVKVSVYYSSFSANNLFMEYFCMHFIVYIVWNTSRKIFSQQQGYQWFVGWDKSQLYPSTLVQYLSY